MTTISNSFKFNLHGITGAMAIFLMAFHAIWATIVLKEKMRSLYQSFILSVYSFGCLG